MISSAFYFGRVQKPTNKASNRPIIYYYHCWCNRPVNEQINADFKCVNSVKWTIQKHRERRSVKAIFTTMMKYMRFCLSIRNYCPTICWIKKTMPKTNRQNLRLSHIQLSLVRCLCEVNMVQSIILFKITRFSGFYFFWSHFTKRKRKRTEFTYFFSSKT